jgi:hypothetical protein
MNSLDQQPSADVVSSVPHVGPGFGTPPSPKWGASRPHAALPVRHAVHMDESVKKSPDRTLQIIIGIIAALVLIALVVVFTRGAPRQLDASSPAGTVQRYSEAAIAGDEAAAGTYLTAAALARCAGVGSFTPDNVRVVLVSTTERAESADVKVSIVTSYPGGPFGNSESESVDVFDLVKVDGQWLIDDTPWQLTVCPPSKGTT